LHSHDAMKASLPSRRHPLVRQLGLQWRLCVVALLVDGALGLNVVPSSSQLAPESTDTDPVLGLIFTILETTAAAVWPAFPLARLGAGRLVSSGLQAQMQPAPAMRASRGTALAAPVAATDDAARPPAALVGLATAQSRAPPPSAALALGAAAAGGKVDPNEVISQVTGISPGALSVDGYDVLIVLGIVLAVGFFMFVILKYGGFWAPLWAFLIFLVGEAAILWTTGALDKIMVRLMEYFAEFSTLIVLVIAVSAIIWKMIKEMVENFRARMNRIEHTLDSLSMTKFKGRMEEDMGLSNWGYGAGAGVIAANDDDLADDGDSTPGSAPPARNARRPCC